LCLMNGYSFFGSIGVGVHFFALPDDRYHFIVLLNKYVVGGIMDAMLHAAFSDIAIVHSSI
jgi:hypothetical protein